MLYHASECLVQHLVTPAVADRTRRMLRNAHTSGCNGGQLVDFGTTQAEGWRALAQRHLCILQEQLYSITTKCRLSQQRGAYIESVRYDLYYDSSDLAR